MQLVIILNVISVWVNYGKTSASGYAVAFLVVSIWTFGISSNFRHLPHLVPNWASWLSMAAGVGGIITLVIGLVGK